MHIQSFETVDDSNRHHAIIHHAKYNDSSNDLFNTDDFPNTLPDAYANTKSNTNANIG